MPLLLKILLCVVLAEALGGLGGFVTARNLDGWYANLERPPGTPPNAVFGPVWVILYAMMGAAFALVWHGGFETKDARSARTVFFIQLLLNLAWTPVFFGTHQLAAALVVIVAMLVMIALTIFFFAKRSRLAALLLVPYVLWVSYATYLNAGYLLRNAG